MTPRSGPDRAPLRALADVAADEPAIATLAGHPGGALAVPEHARAITVAGLSRATDRRPILVAVPTTGDADRLHADLTQHLGDEVELFPAWETLPFERVSPSVETMGRRLRTMWRLRTGADGEAGGTRGACVVVAPVRALVQRLGPHVEDIEPITVRPKDRVDPDELVERLVAAGYRREYQV